MDTLLPPSRAISAGSSVDTGTPATNGFAGNASRSRSHARSAPATIASTTSFTVTPNAALTSFTSRSGSVAVANERDAVSARLKGVRSVSMIGRGVATSVCRR